VKRSLSALAASAWLLAADLARAAAPIPGLDALLDRPDLDFIVVGELHGTAEMPSMFGDLVLEAAKRGPVTVSLEIMVQDQPLVEAYVHSSGSTADRAALLTGAHWRQPLKDGRSSRAMFDLVERLRLAVQANPALKVVACQPVMSADGVVAYEKAMGACWIAARKSQPSGRVLILVGNAHSSLAPIFDYAPAASYLPAARTFSLNTAEPGGEAWNCNADGCGPRDMGGGLGPTERGVHLSPVQDGKRVYDGALAPGGRFTVSPPMAP
jgi:hypothetical protein